MGGAGRARATCAAVPAAGADVRGGPALELSDPTQYVNFERSYERGLEDLCRALGVQSSAMRAAEQQRLRKIAKRETTET